MFYKKFAAEYNCAAYGAGNYNSSESCATLTGNSLANTGTDVTIGIAGGALLIVIGLATFASLILSRRKSLKNSTK